MSNAVNEGVGVSKLIEFLNTTRRQAELSINNLNEKIEELAAENEFIQKNLDQMMVERNHYKHLAETLEQASSTKSRLRERDDWKSLVESIQNDRSRLQEECNTMAEQLEQARHQVEQITQQKPNDTGLTSWFLEDSSNNQGNGGSRVVAIPDSPSSTVRRLRQDNEQLRGQLAEEQKSRSEDINTLHYEIAKLQDELGYYKRHSSPSVPNYQPGSDIKYAAISSSTPSSTRIQAVNGNDVHHVPYQPTHYHISRPQNPTPWLNPINALSFMMADKNGSISRKKQKMTSKDLIAILHV